MVRLRNIHSVFEKDPQVGQIFSALEKKKKPYQTQHYFVHGYEEELNITVNNELIEFYMPEYTGF